jgi:preprotein translocase subunit SecA
MSELLLSPHIAQGFYPERKRLREGVLDRVWSDRVGRVRFIFSRRRRHIRRIVRLVNQQSVGLEQQTYEELQEQIQLLRYALRREGLTTRHIARSFALIRELAERKLGLRHHDVQLMGGWVLLHGMIAEMDTGEGKTLTATLAACTAALAGIPVHVITVNDYLAARDAEGMRPLYEAFGLRVGVVTQGVPAERRREAYGSDITYCTNKEIVFDYLKDRLILGQRSGAVRLRLERLYSNAPRIEQVRLRGLCFAIVDEADSVLIDEARVPLIISSPDTNLFEEQIYHRAIELAKQLTPRRDYKLKTARRKAELTPRGTRRVERSVQELGGLWKSRVWREEMICQALLALKLFRKDRDYIIQDDKIVIVDENTGRVMKDRSWERGLHQLIEAKEGCPVSTQKETLARMSFQRFFRRYLHLSGMTGTAQETAQELWQVYGLKVVRIPTNKPSARRALPARLFLTAEAKWQAVVRRIGEVHAGGQPVLVGTCSVEASEHLSRLLEHAGMPHQVLNARQDQQEAEIIAQAGQKGQITVATNMAGRGTDIKLGPGVRELGGLHVIATERHESRRIDRQLFGRCGRQGDPGSFEIFASLEDTVLMKYVNNPFGYLTLSLMQVHSFLGNLAGKLYTRYAQKQTEYDNFTIRRNLMLYDEHQESTMAFSGKME